MDYIFSGSFTDIFAQYLRDEKIRDLFFILQMGRRICNYYGSKIRGLFKVKHYLSRLITYHLFITTLDDLLGECALNRNDITYTNLDTESLINVSSYHQSL